jgi:CRISPR type I-E-associated protein CasB/Cse2
MQSLNLATSKIWSCEDDTGDSIRLSLPEILLFNYPLYHAPSFGYLAPLQHELLSSILQCCVDSIWPKGISKKHYSQLINIEDIQLIYPLVLRICHELKRIQGFSLAGNSAFLQMPTAWKKSGNKMQIARLMWPFIPNTHKTSQAKGIRRLAPVPAKLGPDLTALFLFSSCALPKGGTRYWTIGNLAGRAILHAKHGRILRQQLFSSVLPGYSPHWKKLQPLPWISQCMNNGGLGFDDRPPFLPYLTGKKKLSGTANLRFFQARGIMLDPPESGVCDVSGEFIPVFTSYHLLEDRAVHKQVMGYTKSKKSKKIKAANVLGKMFTKATHPSVSGNPPGTLRDNKDKNIKFNFPYHGYSIPAWAVMGKVLPFPSQTIQAHNGIIPSPPELDTCNWSFTQLKYAAKQQDARGLFQYHFPENIAFATHKMEQAAFLEEATDTSIQQVRSGMRLLSSRRNSNQRHKQNTSEQVNHDMLSISQQLWNTADTLFYDFLVIEPDTKTWQIEVTFSLKNEMHRCWHRFLENNWDSKPLSFEDYKRGYRATRIALGENYMDYDRSYLEANPVVRAGRAFAQAYQELSTSERSQLLNESTPYISGFFWICMRKARKEDPDAFQRIYEQVLPLLADIIPVHNEKNIGRILAEQKRYVHQRRMELLFSEEDRDMLLDILLQLFHIISSKNGRAIKVDFGVLLLDLTQFHFRPGTVIRRWATDYFSSNIPTDQKEDDHVQA